MQEENKKTKAGRVSVLNWIGTLILCSIPGVNIPAALCFLIFGKAQAKRTYAGAVLIITLVLLIAICVAFLLFADQMTQLASRLREMVPQAMSGSILVMD